MRLPGGVSYSVHTSRFPRPRTLPARTSLSTNGIPPARGSRPPILRAVRRAPRRDRHVAPRSRAVPPPSKIRWRRRIPGRRDRRECPLPTATTPRPSADLRKGAVIARATTRARRAGRRRRPACWSEALHVAIPRAGFGRRRARGGCSGPRRPCRCLRARCRSRAGAAGRHLPTCGSRLPKAERFAMARDLRSGWSCRFLSMTRAGGRVRSPSRRVRRAPCSNRRIARTRRSPGGSGAVPRWTRPRRGAVLPVDRGNLRDRSGAPANRRRPTIPMAGLPPARPAG